MVTVDVIVVDVLVQFVELLLLHELSCLLVSASPLLLGAYGPELSHLTVKLVPSLVSAEGCASRTRAWLYMNICWTELPNELMFPVLPLIVA